MPSVRESAQARVGLLGNPSDMYAGRGLGFAIAELGASVELAPSDSIELPNEVFEAGWTVGRRLLRERGADPDSRPFRLTFESNVPFQSGLSGSSALLIAALRAWAIWFETKLEPSPIAQAALSAEVDELGIRAGPLDRLVQAHGGLLAMDFADPFAEASVAPLSPDLLPPLLIAWHGTPGTSSGDVHAPIFERWQAGDAGVRSVMEQLATNADEGRRALETHDNAAFRACINKNFDLRASLFDIAPADRALIELGRERDAGTKFPGSGGAVLFACKDEAHRDEIDAACIAAGNTTLRPTVSPPVR